MKPKLIVICGPTATGKSDLAVQIAKKFKGEIISADSRQIYKGLDIGSGKITKKEMRGITHHMLDISSPKNIFTVHDFQKQTQKIIQQILNRNRFPIICGGTGFYIQSIVDGIVLPDVPPNWKLRKDLEKKSNTKLFKILLRLDPMRAKTIDQNNPRRLIRAIEIAKKLGKVPKLNKNLTIYRKVLIGLDCSPEELKRRIKKRLIKRINQGMIKEVKNLHQNGLSWKRLFSFGLEYRYISLYLQEKISRKEMIEKLNNEIWHYAKRQRTWFRKDKKIKWFDSSKKTTEKKITNLIKRFI